MRYKEYLVLEVYRLDEKMTADKAFNKLVKAIGSVETPLELKMAM